MKVDEKITLSNGEVYGLLLDKKSDKVNCFLATLLIEEEKLFV